MDKVFLFKLSLSFFIGGGWIVFAMYLADKLGAKIGGLISGLPSTLLFGLFFIAWTQSPDAAVVATGVVPILGGVSSLFLVLYVFLLNFGLLTALATSLIVWGLGAYGVLQIGTINYNFSLLIYLVFYTISYLLLEKVIQVKTVKGVKIRQSPKLILDRGLLSGTMVALSVLLGKIGGPTLGGIFALFPAMFVSTLIVSYLSHGAKFSASLAKSAAIASMSIVIYSIGVRYTYLPLGLLGGTFVSIILSIVSGFLIYRHIITRLQ